MKGKICNDYAENIVSPDKRLLLGKPDNWDLWNPVGDYCRELSFGM
jgi:hypothetical protein